MDIYNKLKDVAKKVDRKPGNLARWIVKEYLEKDAGITLKKYLMCDIIKEDERINL